MATAGYGVMAECHTTYSSGGSSYQDATHLQSITIEDDVDTVMINGMDDSASPDPQYMQRIQGLKGGQITFVHVYPTDGSTTWHSRMRAAYVAGDVMYVRIKFDGTVGYHYSGLIHQHTIEASADDAVRETFVMAIRQSPSIAAGRADIGAV